MEQLNIYPGVPQVSAVPDADERRQIRKRYNKIALTLIINILIFNGIAIAGHLLLMTAAGDKVRNNELFNALFSYLTPIISETIAIFAGIRIMGLDLKPLVTLNGFGGGTVAKLIVLSLGLQTAASIIASLVAMLLDKLGLEGQTVQLEATTSLPANVFMYFYACLLGPVLEELLYRGVLLQSMRKYNERFAIFISAAIFGLMHQNYQQFILGFLVGIPLAVVTIKHGSLVPSIFAHIFLNTSGMLFNCWMQYASPDFYRAALNGNSADLFSMPAEEILPIICTVIFRYGFALAGLILGIIILAKGGNMSRPTPAGKSRTWPVFITAAAWWCVFAVYIFLNFVLPFIRF